MSERVPPTPPTSTPDEHDAWLRHALLHAPDASAAPPDALRQAILAEARSAVRASPVRAAAPAGLDPLMAFWSWLARPPVAAGFASVMAATLVGMMWWDRPMDQATLSPPPSRMAAASPAAKADAVSSLQAAPALPPATDALIAPKAAALVAPPPATPEPPVPPSLLTANRVTPAAAEALEKHEGAGAAEDKKRQGQAPPSTVPATPDITPFPMQRRQDAEPTRNAEAAADSARKLSRESSPSLSPSPSTGKDEPGATPSALDRNETQRRAEAKPFEAPNAGALGSVAKAAPAQRRRAEAAGNVADALDTRAPVAAQSFATGPSPAPAPVAAPRPTPMPAPAMAAAPQGGIAAPAAVPPERADRVEARLRPLAEVLESLALDPQPWSRVDVQGQAAPIDGATRRWLADLDTATAGRWQMRGERASRLEGTTIDDARSLSLRREGRPALQIRLQERGVLVESASGPAWFAPLPAGALARQRAALPPVDR